MPPEKSSHQPQEEGNRNLVQDYYNEKSEFDALFEGRLHTEIAVTDKDGDEQIGKIEGFMKNPEFPQFVVHMPDGTKQYVDIELPNKLKE